MSEELTHSEMQKIGEEVVGVLCTIFDPEIPVDIYQLGLIYDVKVSTERDVHIMMTLTSPNCPVAESLPQEVKEKSRAFDSVNDVEVEITFDPPWDKIPFTLFPLHYNKIKFQVHESWEIFKLQIQLYHSIMPLLRYKRTHLMYE